MKQKLLSLFLMAFIPMAMMAFDCEIDGICYNLDESTKTASVTFNSSGASFNSMYYKGDITIPMEISYSGDNYTVTSIGSSAFYGCSSMTSVTIPSTVTSIESKAFLSCKGLTSITIPESVTSIGKEAFNNCSGLTSVTIPSTVTSIGSYAFYNCSSMTSITIPEGVTSIGGLAFYGCSGLTSVTIPKGVTSIGSTAFAECSSLTSITVEEENTVYDSRDNCNAIIETATNTLVLGCKNTIIPEGVTSIGESAFQDCSGLTSITIPSSVTSIGKFAFSNCSDLTSITIPSSVTCFDYAFNRCIGLTSVTILEGVTSIGESAFSDCTGLTSINIPEGVTTFEACAFSGCTGLTSVTIPEGVTSIGSSAFDGCTGLTSVTIPEGVTSIGNSAFSGCTGLTSVTILEGVTSIGTFAFRNCSGLTSITIPESVTSIGSYAFYNCSSMTSITIPKGVTSIDNNAFRNCSSLTSVEFHCKEIGSFWFRYLTSIETVIIGDEVTAIGGLAFLGCSGLKSITIDEGNTVYDSRDNCNAIIKTSTNTLIYGFKITTIPEGVTSIGYNAFQDCSDLTSVTIPSTVTSIGSYAFYNCSSMTSITIPEGVTSIGERAFNGCSGLTSVTISSSVTSIGNNYTFSGVGTYSNPCVLNVPDGFDFGGVDTSGDYFLWKGGYFKLPTETTITISSAGVGTFCYDKDLDFSSVNGLKAYVAVGYNKNTGNVIVVEVKDVPAGTGLYLKGTPGTYQVPFGSSSSYYTNMLVGTTASTTINATDGSMTNFILYNGTNGIGFYTFNNSYTIGANKAYLQIPTSMVSSSSSANYLGIEFEEGVTGIDNVHSATEQAEWYSLDGRRLNSKPTQKGVYIVNGKKVVVK